MQYCILRSLGNPMGILSELASSKSVKAAPTGRKAAPTIERAQRESRTLWNQMFRTAPSPGSDEKPGYGQKPVPGGTRSRSVSGVGNQASFERLLTAMRSGAPGGWSDDRWEQTIRHFVGISYVAIHRICMQLMRAEFQVFRQDFAHPDGKRPVRQDEEAWEIVRLLKRPNRQDSFGRMMYRWGQQIRLTGSALTWLVPNKFGKPYELYSIPTAIAIPQPATNPDYPDGYYRIQPVYPYGPFSSYPTPATAVGAAIGAQWMMNWKYPHPLLRYDGYSPQTAGRLHMDSFEMIDRSRFYSMRRGIHPSAVLNFDDFEGAEPLPEPEIERIKADFENEQMGPENWGKLFVAAPGSKLENWGQAPVDMAFESGWDQLADFILGGIFGITKPAAGMVEDSSYSTLYATLKQLHLITIEPETEMIGAELTHWLGPYWGDDIIIEVRAPRIDDQDLKIGILNVLMSAKAITKGEMRKELNMPLWHDQRDEEIAGEMPMMAPGMPGDPMGAPGMAPMAAPGEIPANDQAPAGPGEPVAPGQENSLDELLLMDQTEKGLRDEDDRMIENTRPMPGKLSAGSLDKRGPRTGKRLEGYLTKELLSDFKPRKIKGSKSLYERIKEVIRNGH
jgi:phage portal protein BeeE